MTEMGPGRCQKAKIRAPSSANPQEWIELHDHLYLPLAKESGKTPLWHQAKGSNTEGACKLGE